MAVMTTERILLLPPNATSFERGLEAAAARVEDVPAPGAALWNPAACPLPILPWLAWAVSADSWNPEWSEATKRAAVASAIAEQRRKGTPLAVKAVLARFDALLELVEWFDMSPEGAPYTFEIRLPLAGAGGAIGGARATAAFAEAIIADVTRAKNARSHFGLVQEIAAAGAVGIVGAATAARYDRYELSAVTDLSPVWATYLQTEDGEPLELEASGYLEQEP